MQNITQWPWRKFTLAWFTTFTLASICHSQFNIWQLQQVNIVMPWSERLSMTGQDWLGLLPTYGLILLVGLLLAWWFSFCIIHWLNTPTTTQRWFYIFSGGAAILTIHTAMYPILNVTLIAGAREWGLYLQVICGMIGGAIYYSDNAIAKKEM